jgi:hypothetical protein
MLARGMIEQSHHAQLEILHSTQHRSLQLLFLRRGYAGAWGESSGLPPAMIRYWPCCPSVD